MYRMRASIPSNNLKHLTNQTTTSSLSRHTNRTPTNSHKISTNQTKRLKLPPLTNHPHPNNLLIRNLKLLVLHTRSCRSKTKRKRKRCANLPDHLSASMILKLPSIIWKRLLGCSKRVKCDFFWELLIVWRKYYCLSKTKQKFYAHLFLLFWIVFLKLLPILINYVVFFIARIKKLIISSIKHSCFLYANGSNNICNWHKFCNFF